MRSRHALTVGALALTVAVLPLSPAQAQTAGYAAEVQADAPLAYWRLDEGAGTTFADSSGNGRQLALTDAATYPAGKSGAALGFGSAAGYARSSTALIAQSTVTLEAWVKLPALPSARTVVLGATESASNANNAPFDKTLSVRADGVPVFYVYSGATTDLVGTAPLALDTWHHLVGTVGPGGAALYVNGSEQVLRADVTTSYTGAQYAYLRGTPGPAYGAGSVQVDEPAVYGTRLSTARVQAHYAAATPPAPSPAPSPSSSESPAPTSTGSGTVTVSGPVRLDAGQFGALVLGLGFLLTTTVGTFVAQLRRPS